MASVNELKATVRPKSGKGTARAERRAGRVPGIIYGGDKPPLNVSLDYNELHKRIYAGHFLTTIYELDIDGTKERVIPRDYQLDPVKDLPVHVDFMRLGEGATIRVSVPIHVRNAEASPGVKRGGAVNIVTHALDVRCPAEAIPASIDVDVAGLEINQSVHLSAITLPPNVRPLTPGDVTLVTIVAPSGYLEEQRAAAEAAAAAAAAPTPEAGAAPAAGAAGTAGGASAAPSGEAAKKP
ncbi:MAG TPA: 50S ribosomal protein L25/general stress protein Ctc [Xanthobacteraceae bacterium]|nr:50S ribosomal protein L25/general stress protein Ctc [Xanthobacteraceae bacterium]